MVIKTKQLGQLFKLVLSSNFKLLNPLVFERSEFKVALRSQRLGSLEMPLYIFFANIVSWPSCQSTALQCKLTNVGHRSCAKWLFGDACLYDALIKLFELKTTSMPLQNEKSLEEDGLHVEFHNEWSTRDFISWG